MIKFGLLLNSSKLFKWQVECIESLVSMDQVELSLVVFSTEDYSTPERFGKEHILYRALRKYLHQCMIKESSFKKRNANHLFDGTPELKCKIFRKGKFGEYFYQEDIKTIQSFNLDYILRFGFGVLKGEILTSAQYGVWSFHAADEQKYRGGPADLLGILNDDTYSAAILQKLTERLDGGVILRKGFFRFFNDSPNKTKVNMTKFIKQWPAQVTIDIINGEADYLEHAPTSSAAPVSYAPANFAVIKIVLKMILNYLKNRIRRLFFYEDWNIGLMRCRPEMLFDRNMKWDIDWFPKESSRYYLADPFGIIDGDAGMILCENYLRDKGKGQIDRIDFSQQDSKITFAYPSEFIASPHHLAYPSVFNIDDKIYCMNLAPDGIDLYLIEDRVPRKISTILKGLKPVDPTIFQFNGYFWLAFTLAETGSHEALHLYYADDLSGQFLPHTNNPVKVDIRSSRPAGTPFESAGELYRPAQDCQKTYGGAIAINRVNEINPTRFSEETVVTLPPPDPFSYGKGFHTMSFIGEDLLVLDGKREVVKPAIAISKLLLIFPRIIKSKPRKSQ